MTSEKNFEPFGQLAIILREIARLDHTHPVDYDRRNQLTMMALGAAVAEGIPAGIRIDQNDTEWPVIYIELPTGQVSWHVPQHTRTWDGHDFQEKYARLSKALWNHGPNDDELMYGVRGAGAGGGPVNRRTEIALAAVAAERERQDVRKAEGRFLFTCADDGLALAEKFTILGEEFGEVAREALTNSRRRLARDTTGTDAALYAELAQVAAVAVAWMESLGPNDDADLGVHHGS